MALHEPFPGSQPVSQLASQEGPQGLSAAARPTRGLEGLASSVPFATTVPSQRGSTKNGLRPQIALPVPLPDRFLQKTLRLRTRMQTTTPEGLSQTGLTNPNSYVFHGKIKQICISPPKNITPNGPRLIWRYVFRLGNAILLNFTMENL